MTSGSTHPWHVAAIPMIEPEFLVDVLSAASDIAVIVDPKGRVMAALVNPKESPYGNLDHWVGNNLAEFLTEESVPKFDRVLRNAATASSLVVVLPAEPVSATSGRTASRPSHVCQRWR